MSSPDREPEDTAEQPSEQLPDDRGPTGSSAVDEAMRRVDGDAPRGPDTHQTPTEKDKQDRLQYEAEKVDFIDKMKEKGDPLQDLDDAAKAFGEMGAAAEAAYQNSQSAADELGIGKVRGEEVGTETPTEQSEPNESNAESQRPPIDLNSMFDLRPLYQQSETETDEPELSRPAQASDLVAWTGDPADEQEGADAATADPIEATSAFEETECFNEVGFQFRQGAETEAETDIVNELVKAGVVWVAGIMLRFGKGGDDGNK